MIAGELSNSGPARRRRGFGLVEMAVAGALLMAMILITLQLVGWAAREGQAVARREAATRLVGTVMERILARPFATISTEALVPLVTEAGQERSPSAGVLSVEVIPIASIDDHRQKKVVVQVRWPDLMPGSMAPVRLVAWTTDRRGTQP